MPAPALIRDSFFGQVVYELSRHRFFQHPDEQPGFPFELEQFKKSPSPSGNNTINSSQTTIENVTLTDRPEDEESRLPQRISTISQITVVANDKDSERTPLPRSKAPVALQDELLMAEAEKPEVQRQISESRIVTWYGPDDGDNPQNVRPSLTRQ